MTLLNDRLTDLQVFNSHLCSELELLLLEQICCMVICLEDPSSIILLPGEENSELTLFMEYFDYIYCRTNYFESLLYSVLIID